MGATLEDGTVVSRDAEHSTYATVADESGIVPAPADGVEQTLAAPAGGAAQASRSQQQTTKKPESKAS